MGCKSVILGKRQQGLESEGWLNWAGYKVSLRLCFYFLKKHGGKTCLLYHFKYLNLALALSDVMLSMHCLESNTILHLVSCKKVRQVHKISSCPYVDLCYKLWKSSCSQFGAVMGLDLKSQSSVKVSCILFEVDVFMSGWERGMPCWAKTC